MRLTIEAECQRLIYSFAYGQDHGQADVMAALFTVDGALDRPGGTIQGRDRICAHFSRHIDRLLMRNVVSNVVVTVIDEPLPDTTVAGAPAKVTAVTPSRFAPEIRTDVPPFVDPEFGRTEMMTGAGAKLAASCREPIVHASGPDVRVGRGLPS